MLFATGDDYKQNGLNTIFYNSLQKRSRICVTSGMMTATNNGIGGDFLKLVFLIGDAAVGKMTVGQELMKITDLRLFHNHMTIEPVIVAFFIYFLLSTIFLANLKSIYKNLLSTILIVIIGILIWVIALSHGINVSNGYLLNSELWQLYAIYNMYSSLFLDESGINNQYLFLLFSFLPMISMALGLLLKQGVAKDK